MSSCKSGLGARRPHGTNEASAGAGLCDGLDAGVVYCELGGGQASSGRILLDRMVWLDTANCETEPLSRPQLRLVTTSPCCH